MSTIYTQAAPIAVFAFNRPEHLQRCLTTLAANHLASESSLTIFCDGARNAAEKQLTDAVREVAHSTKGFATLSVVENTSNKGLANSIITGVSALIAKEKRLIIIEDDLITSPYFLQYMNDGLNIYETTDAVASVHGYMCPHEKSCSHDTFFLRGTDCWGWGTWHRAWRHFEADAQVLLDTITRRNIAASFNADNSYDFTGMLEDVIRGRVSSWAVRWHASAFLADMYTLYPRESLVFHSGSDGSGTNCCVDDLFDVPLAQSPITVAPIPVVQDAQMYIERKRHLQRESGGTLGIIAGRIWRKFPMLKKIWRTCRNFVKAY